jgi:hypothetical protein
MAAARVVRFELGVGGDQEHVARVTKGGASPAPGCRDNYARRR